MVKELDAGDILWQHTEEIKNRGTRELWETWAQESAKALPELVQNFEILPHLPQDETKGTLCSKFQKSDGEIFLERETAEEIMRKYRAFDVWPGIFITTRYGTVGIKECSLEKKSDSVELPCKKGSVWIQTIQLSGKSEASACDIVRGRPDIFRR
jgi:methionyl-tRNA formyltransferase